MGSGGKAQDQDSGSFTIDYSDVDGTMSMSSMVSRWGKAIFGDRFITRNIARSEPFVIGQRGKTFSFVFGNGFKVMATDTSLEALMLRTDTRQGFVYYTTSDKKFYMRDNNTYREMSSEELFQPLTIYEVSGLYELRGYR